jgi:outer membrane protein assembly factor BamB
MDLVVANGRHWPQQNYVLLNDGRARFSVMRPLGVDRATSYACELADLDGDGDLDVVTGNAMAACNIFLNDGSANFTKHPSLDQITSVRSLTLADIDQDDDIDILVTSRGRANIIYLNDGSAGFPERTSFGTSQDSTLDVAVVDINLDDRPDLLLANRDDQENVLLLNTGKTEFTKTPFGTKARNSRAVVIADLNADGKPDCAVGNIGSENCVYFGDGSGVLHDEVRFGQAASQTYSLAASDMDNDGDIDLVAANVQGRNAVYFDGGDGQQFQELLFGDPNSASYGVCIADFDGDQFDDIAVANSNSQNHIFLNRPARSGRRANRENFSLVKSPEAKPSTTAQTGTRQRSSGRNWPAFRGTGARGISDGFPLRSTWNADPEKENPIGVLWRRPVPGLGHSSPIVVDNKIWLATAVAAAGEAPLKVGRGGAPDAADDNGEQSWTILCFDKRSGKELWSRTVHQGKPRATRHAKATHANTTVTVDGNYLVAFFGSEGLYCYDLAGELKWKRDLGVVNISKYGIGWGYASSPAVHNGRIVLVCDDPQDPYLVALSLLDGEELWRVSRKGDSDRSWGTPLIHQSKNPGVTQVVVNGWPSVVSYDFTDGRELWRIRGGGDNPVPTPFVANEHIYITRAHGTQSPIYVVNPAARGDLTAKLDGAPNETFLWNVLRGGSYMSTPVVYGDYLYVGNSNGVLRCFHAHTGQKIYEKRLEGGAGMIASLVAGDNKIYCASENGKVYVVPAGSEFRLMATNSMGAPCFATPAISEGVIFVRTTQELIAIK